MQTAICGSNVPGNTTEHNNHGRDSNCNGNGLCKGGKCQCYQGYSGAECTSFCPHNCTLAPNVFGTLTPRGRCSIDNKCICNQRKQN